MTEPTTEAGQALLGRLAEPDDYEWGNRIRADILAIEAEARQQEADQCIERGHLTSADLATIRAEARHATVERIRTAFGGLYRTSDTVRAILDAEASHD
jgi:hypothetical protein